jgi:AAA+ ATPase superfamily predicted ATPase
MDLIESGNGTKLVEIVKNEFNQYLGLVFEEVAKQFLVRLDREGKLPFSILRVGRWWHRGEEIDVVALNDRTKQALFVEVKWGNLTLKDAKRILKDLRRKAELTNLKGYEKYFGIVAKEVEGKEKIEDFAFDLSDIDSIM